MDPDISIRGGIKTICFKKKRNLAVIPSDNYKTWKKDK
jgi:hypothetical protein